MTSNLSYAFGGDAEAKTPEDLARKRLLVDALMQQEAGSPAPRNIGEGLSAIGKALMARQARNGLTSDVSRIASDQTDLWNSPAAKTLFGLDTPQPTQPVHPVQSVQPSMEQVQPILHPNSSGAVPVGPISPQTGQAAPTNPNMPPALSAGQPLPVPQVQPGQPPLGATSGRLAALNIVLNDPRFPFARPEKQQFVLDQIKTLQAQNTPLAQLQLQQAQDGLDKGQFELGIAKDQKAAMEKYISELPTDQQGLWRADPEAAAKIMAQQAKNGGEGQYFGTPIFLHNEDGSTSVALPNKSGGLKVLDTQGKQVVGPFEKSMDVNRGKAVGEQVGAAQAALPGQTSDVQTTNMQIQSLLDSPDLKDAVGYSSWKPDFLTGNGVIDVRSRIKQLMGTSFLQSRQMLKGGGAITDYEGGKADAAYSRMEQAIRAGDPAIFKEALTDFQANVNRGLAKLQAQAGMSADRQGGVVTNAPIPAPANAPKPNLATVPPAAIQFLKENPNSAAQFDAKYGVGAAAAVRGQ